MAKFLPDSVTYTAYKKAKRLGTRRSLGEIDPKTFWKLVYAVKRFGARRKKQRARADFYKKHGYYQQ